jgi:hypothetical protein
LASSVASGAATVSLTVAATTLTIPSLTRTQARRRAASY